MDRILRLLLAFISGIAVVWPDLSLLALATIPWIWLVLRGSLKIAGAFALRRLEKERRHDAVVPGPSAAPDPPAAPLTSGPGRVAGGRVDLVTGARGAVDRPARCRPW